MKKIELSFDSSLRGLVGFSYGKENFKEQVENQVNSNFDEEIEIIFPDNITRIASSFTQGFFNKLISTYGYYDVIKHVTVKTQSDGLTRRVFKGLE
ncbi:STAS-like domain-containing protein [Convivina intestini]|uniref:STAS-like domain-containing protein n=1 Tax=Convivina intestini TaxID=1505726 RepID=UPI00200D77DF|nr:DUF4325 domain-containing protein [Convivina intestini]CAH1856501.1 hypothetical protein R078131_01415 [Convivina intestini]